MLRCGKSSVVVITRAADCRPRRSPPATSPASIPAISHSARFPSAAANAASKRCRDDRRIGKHVAGDADRMIRHTAAPGHAVRIRPGRRAPVPVNRVQLPQPRPSSLAAAAATARSGERPAAIASSTLGPR